MMASNVSLSFYRPEIMLHDRRETLFSNLMKNSLVEGPYGLSSGGCIPQVSRLRGFCGYSEVPYRGTKVTNQDGDFGYCYGSRGFGSCKIQATA
jgi:hypothetical protein